MHSNVHILPVTMSSRFAFSLSVGGMHLVEKQVTFPVTGLTTFVQSLNYIRRSLFSNSFQKMSRPLLVTGNVFFMGVARMSPHAVIVASNSYHADTDLSAVKQVLDQPTNNFVPGQHFNFNAGEVTWHLVAGKCCQMTRLQ